MKHTPSTLNTQSMSTMNDSSLNESLFMSLSLDDTFNTAGASSKYVSAIDNDAMDIDTDTITEGQTPEPDSGKVFLTSTPTDWKAWGQKEFASHNELRARDINKFLREQNIPEKTIQPDETNYETADETRHGDADTSLLSGTSLSALSMSILLPSQLGAQYAIGGRKQKLLMPPPPRTVSSEQKDLLDGKLSPIANNIVTNLDGFSSTSESSSSSFVYTAERKNGYKDEKPEEYTYNYSTGEYEETSGSDISSFGDNSRSAGVNRAGTNSGTNATNFETNQFGHLARSHQGQFPNQFLHLNLFSSPSVYNHNSPWNSTPMQVHHHHYYSAGTVRDILSQNTPQFLSRFSPVHCSGSQKKSPNRSRAGPSRTAASSVNIQERLQLLQDDDDAHNHEGGESDDDVSMEDADELTATEDSVVFARQETAALAQLPAPWQQNSTPHERVPYILSSYLQLVLNICATAYGGHLLFSMVQAIRQDINHKAMSQVSAVLADIESCKRSYELNNCQPENIVPALEGHCARWLRCMNQNPYEGGGNMAIISARHFGLLLNSLIEPLGIKFFLVLGGFMVLLFTCNFAFGFIRARAYYGWDNGREKRTF